LQANHGEDQVDREGVIKTLREFAETNQYQIDWDSIGEVPNEALVNALSMMSPFGPKEKQALLEASDLKGRADVLVAITEFELARGKSDTMRLQ
jgi:Lon protease-like protein